MKIKEGKKELEMLVKPSEKKQNKTKCNVEKLNFLLTP